MSRRRRRTVTKAARPNLPVQPAATYTADQMALAVRTTAQRVAAARPLPQNPADAQVPFGPGVPLPIAPINPVDPRTGRPQPRQWEYPQSWNLPGFSDRLIPWAILRAAADQIALFRQCIEVRKNEISTLDWDIVISKKAVDRAALDDPSTSRHDIQTEMRKRLQPHIARLTAFWEEPDPRNGLDFIGWATKLLEEHFVLDAVAVYPRRTRGGDPYGLEILDGSTIKPLLDQYGHRPLPPNPAFQQLLQGFPRGEFVADTEVGEDREPLVLNGYESDRLVYLVHNVRATTPYGYSAVEQALDDGDLWLKRHGWLKAEYSDGVMPSGWLLAGEGQADWSPTQLQEYGRAFNDYYAGQTALRQRYQILPYGMKPSDTAGSDAGEKYKPDYDLFLLKLVARHFDTTMAELGFTEAKGLGSTGWHEGQADIQDRAGTKPTLARLQSWCTRLMRKYLDAPPELQFRIAGLEAEDEAQQDTVAGARVDSGRMTLNEDRDRTGLPRYTFPEADQPYIKTATGVFFLEGALARSQAAMAALPAGPVAPGDGGDAGDQADVVDEQDAPAAAATTTPADDAELAKANELAAYRKWARRNTNPRRPFEMVHNSPDDLAKLDWLDDAIAAGRILVKADQPDEPEAGGADPKDQDVQQAWPGWTIDLALAARYAAALSQGLLGALNPKRLVERWLAARGTGPDATAGSEEPGHRAARVADARHWLGDAGTSLEPPLRAVLTDLYTEGYLVGDRSAVSILTGGPVDWGGWTPGHMTAARKLLSADGRQVGLDLLLSAWDVPIKSISANRLDDLAAVLADGLDAHQSPLQIAKAVEGILDDPKWARMVTLTELSRATTAAAHDRYSDAGVAATEWVTAPDDRVCRICGENRDAGPVPLGEPFPSGDVGPPAHPHCRCAPIPVIDLSKADWIEALHPRDNHGRFVRGGSAPAVSIKRTLANLAAASDDDLLDVFTRVSGRSRMDSLSRRHLEDIDRELARREGSTELVAIQETPEHRKIDDLVGRGYSYAEAYADVYGHDSAHAAAQHRGEAADINRRKGETREQATRRMYAETTYLAMLQAEERTRGNLLSKAGVAAGIEPASLFSGQRARARKYASEELKRFWSEVTPRQTYSEFRAALIGDSRARARAQESKLGGSGRDFDL
jgi:SPP1 gp7 family putative phage head morphogenesis protein